MEKPGFETFAAIRKYTLKLVKVLQNQKRREKSGLNLVDAYGGDSGEGDQQDEHGDDDEARAFNILVAFDDLSRSMWAGLVFHKGAADYWSVTRPVRWMRSMGYGRTNLRTYQEPTVKSLAEEVRTTTQDGDLETIVEHSAVCD